MPKKPKPTLDPAYSLVALTDPKWAARLAKEARKVKR